MIFPLPSNVTTFELQTASFETLLASTPSPPPAPRPATGSARLDLAGPRGFLFAAQLASLATLLSTTVTRVRPDPTALAALT